MLFRSPSPREPAVHQRQQVASNDALIRMAHEDLLRIVGVDGNLASAAVITAATEWTIEANFIAAAVSVEGHATFGRRLFERCVGLKLIDVHVTRPIHDARGKRRSSSAMVR